MTDSGRKGHVENALAGIVLTAQTFNPSIFTETWLVANGVLQADALVGVRVFSPEIAQFQTAGFQVFVIPPQAQITFGIFEADCDSGTPIAVAKRVVELLPHTPYQALGLNFDIFVAPPSGQDFNCYDRALLGTGEYGLLREFSASDARFGRYFSKDCGQSRLRLDVKPVQAGPDKKDLLQFSFNFHHEISQLGPQDRARKLAELLTGWESLRQQAGQLVDLGSDYGVSS